MQNNKQKKNSVTFVSFVSLVPLALATVLVTLSVPSAAFAAVGCASVFGEMVPKEGEWRKDTTHPSAAGEFVKTSPAREKEIADRRKLMEDEVLGIGMPGDTPPIEFFAADGVTQTYLSHSKGDHVITRIALSGVGASGTVKATLLVPVSGHTGAANARSWSKTDTYTVRHDVSTGAKDGWTGSHYGDSAPILVQDAKSLDLVTAQEIEVPLVKGKTVRLLYFRSGSGGPAGYYDGRVIELVWDGT
jgi:hypothetical protein